MGEVGKSVALFFALVNPFLMSVYLLGLIRQLETRVFIAVLARGSLIASVAFVVFAWGGEAIFRDWLHVRFASFQIFGGIVFTLIGLRFVFEGVGTIEELRGSPEHLAGSIAMPFLVGPGTVSASVLIGSQHSTPVAAAIIMGTLAVAGVMLVGLKVLHDRVSARNERIVERYVEIVGRLAALFMGTLAIDMIVNGIQTSFGL